MKRNSYVQGIKNVEWKKECVWSNEGRMIVHDR